MRFNIRLAKPDAHVLRPVIPDNARGPRITAAAGTRLATPYSRGTVKVLPTQKQFTEQSSFFLHAASLDQAFAHCRIFSTAATRRCTNRISVSSLRAVLSHPLPVIALVGRYPANKLIGPRPLSMRLSTLPLRDYRELADLSTRCARHRGTYQGVTNSFAAKLKRMASLM